MTLRDREFQLLKLLLESKCKLRKAIIENANPELIHAIIECIDNYMQHKIPTDLAAINRLAKYKKALRSLVNKSSLKEKKKVIVKYGIQKGGFLEILIPSVISAISALIGTAINNNE